MKRISYLASSVVLAACGGGGTTNPPPDAGPDGGTGPDAGYVWSAPIVIDERPGAGLDLTSAVDSNGRPAVAYFVKIEAGNYSLVLARELSDSVWTRETVPANVSGGAFLTGHFGVSLAFDPAGNPVLAYVGGNTSDSKGDGRWHSLETGASLPSESVIARKSGGAWAQQIVATHSNSIVSTPYAVDNNGTVTGLWPALGLGSDGIVHLVLRDIHYGTDASAYNKSNLEYRKAGAFGGAQQSGEMVVPSVDSPPPGNGEGGAGAYAKMAIFNGRPALSYALSPDQTDDARQVWFALRGSGGWSRQMVSSAQGRPGHGPSLSVSPLAGFAIAFLDAAQGDLLVATSSDGAAFTVETVEALGETGYHPAAAHAAGKLGVLYAYCRGPTDASGQCNPNVNELRFRSKGAAGWSDSESIAPLVPDATALAGDGNGHFVAIYRDPSGSLKASRRTP